MNETKTKTLTIKVTEKEHQQIKELAEKNDVSISKYLYREIFKGGEHNEEK